MHPKRTSYRKIAIEAGVSYKTLYRVLNHAPNVSDSTREKIIRIMKRHGCMDARLPAGCTIVIYVDANKYMLEHARNLVRKLHDFPVSVRLFQASDNETPFLRMVETASRLVYFEFMPEDLLKKCREANPDLKIICINGYQGDINIGCDYFQQGRMAAEYLHNCGFRSLGLFFGKDSTAPFYQSVYDRGMGCFYDWTQKYGHDEPEKITDIDTYFSERRALPEAFLAMNTFLSGVFITKAAEHHLKLKKDYSILTFGRPEDFLQQEASPVDCIYHETKDMIDIALTYLFYPNLGNFHSRISVNMQSYLQIYGTVKAKH